MPTLNWIGKDSVVKHHNDVPFRTLDKQYTFSSVGSEQSADIKSDNKIIHASGKVRIDSIDKIGIFNEELNKYTHQLNVIKRLK